MNLRSGGDIEVMSKALDRHRIGDHIADHPVERVFTSGSDGLQSLLSSSRFFDGFCPFKEYAECPAKILAFDHGGAIDRRHGVFTGTCDLIGVDRCDRRQLFDKFRLQIGNRAQKFQVRAEIARLGKHFEPGGAFLEETGRVWHQGKGRLGNAADHRGIGLNGRCGHKTSQGRPATAFSNQTYRP